MYSAITFSFESKKTPIQLLICKTYDSLYGRADGDMSRGLYSAFPPRSDHRVIGGN